MTRNPDLKREREKTSFDPVEMTYFLYGGRDKVNRKHYMGIVNFAINLFVTLQMRNLVHY